MKQAAILIISAFILVFGGIWEIKYLDDSSKYALSDLEYSKNAIQNNNFQMAKDQMDDLEKDWGSIRSVWNIFIEHSDIDTIDTALIEYKVYVENEDKEEALAKAEVLIKNFQNIVQRQKVQSGNVF